MTEYTFNNQFDRSIEEEEEEINQRMLQRKNLSSNQNPSNTLTASLMRFVTKFYFD